MLVFFMVVTFEVEVDRKNTSVIANNKQTTATSGPITTEPMETPAIADLSKLFTS